MLWEVQVSASDALDGWIKVVVGIVVGLSSVVAFLGGLSAFSPKARLEKRIRAGRAILNALPAGSPAVRAVERSITRAAATLSARTLVPISPWRVATPTIMLCFGMLLIGLGEAMTGANAMLGRVAFAAAIVLIALGEALLGLGTARRSDIRRRKMLAIERGRSSGSLPLYVDEVGRDVVWHRLARMRSLSLPQRLLAFWRLMGGLGGGAL